MIKLGYSASLDRVIRQDDVDTIGISTLDFIEEHLRANRSKEAKELLDYYFQTETQIVQNLMYTWMKDIQLYILDKTNGNGLNKEAETQQENLRNLRYEAGIKKIDEVYTFVDSCQTGEAIALIDWIRRELVATHDLLTIWVQDLLTYIADTMGEEAVPDCINTTYNKFWIPRYRMWLKMKPEERLHLSVEGMRGHFSGPNRRGDLEVVDEGDRYILSFNPCGSGGVMRRGNPENRAGFVPTHGVNKTAYEWTWGKKGVHWYCAHCNLVTEWFTLRDFQHPIRPNGHSLNPMDPCKWYVYKDINDTPEEFYTKLGGQKIGS